MGTSAAISSRLTTFPAGTAPIIRRSSDQLFFVYTNFHGRGGGESMSFFRKTGLQDRNLVFFRDSRCDFYATGVSEDLGSFAELLAWQSEFRGKLAHVRHTYCLGTCGGGYAALLFGHLLGVEAVWAFSPITLVPSPYADVLPPERRDLGLLLRTGNQRTSHHVYYNERCARDTAAAHRLGGADVRLWPVSGAPGEHALDVLMQSDRLEGLFPAAVPQPRTGPDPTA